MARAASALTAARIVVEHLRREISAPSFLPAEPIVRCNKKTNPTEVGCAVPIVENCRVVESGSSVSLHYVAG
jgi:hypothetical protein